MRVITIARKPLAGSVAQNSLKWGTGGLNIDGCRVSYSGELDKAFATPQGKCTSRTGALAGGGIDGERKEFDRPEQKGRFPANLILQGVLAVQYMDSQSGVLHSQDPGTRDSKTKRCGIIGFADSGQHYNDVGTASRFFKQVKV
jgi:site-specific DNA-methyltransferase (adenine-specific)